MISCQNQSRTLNVVILNVCIWHYKEQIRNIFWAFIILTHPSVLQELDFITYTRGGGSWYFRSRSRGGLANFTPIAGMGHLISEPKFKIPTPLSPLLISDKSLKRVCHERVLVGAHFGQSNFSYLQQKLKKEISHILIIITYFKAQTKIEKKEMVRKIEFWSPRKKYKKYCKRLKRYFTIFYFLAIVRKVRKIK